jgi:hypothetical protein
MGFGFPASGGRWAVAASGGLKPSDVARIALAFQARVPEKRRIAVDRHQSGGGNRSRIEPDEGFSQEYQSNE